MLRLYPKDPRYAKRLAQNARWEELVGRLPDVLSGEAKPASPAEACEFAALCGRPAHRLYASAVRLYGEAFAAEPKLADDLDDAHRYFAASFAAAAGRGPEGEKLTAEERKSQRDRANDWLRDHLRAFRAKRERGSLDDRATLTRQLQY